MKRLLLALVLAAPLARAEAPASAICVSLPQDTADAAYLRCLNASLAAAPASAADARTASVQAAEAAVPRGPAAMGLYTRAATQLRLGPNFGVSPEPLRPDAVYRNPLIPPATGR